MDHFYAERKGPNPLVTFVPWFYAFGHLQHFPTFSSLFVLEFIVDSVARNKTLGARATVFALRSCGFLGSNTLHSLPGGYFVLWVQRQCHDGLIWTLPR